MKRQSSREKHAALHPKDDSPGCHVCGQNSIQTEFGSYEVLTDEIRTGIIGILKRLKLPYAHWIVKPKPVVVVPPPPIAVPVKKKVTARGFEGQKQLARPRVAFPNWRPIPPVVGPCKRCSEVGELDDWHWRMDGPPKKLWCEACRLKKWLKAHKRGRAEWKKNQVFLAKVVRTGPKQTRPSLSPEGNVPLMIRLLKEGKSKKEQFAVFKELYAKLGRPFDFKFILSRVKLYRGRALAKMGKSKNEVSQVRIPARSVSVSHKKG